MSRAARAGLDVVALTDHDTVAGHAAARQALPDGLTLLPGMELSCHLGEKSLHLLAYLFDPDDPELAAETRRIREDRVLRARAMVDRLVDLGVRITWDDVAALAGAGVVGRPHIARAMAAEPTSTGTRSTRSARSVWSARPAVSPSWPTRGPIAPCSCPMRRSPAWPPPAWPGWRSSTRTSRNPSKPACSPSPGNST